jgi:mgtE-like transporter
VFNVEGQVSVVDLATISVLGGLLASLVVLLATLLLVTVAVRAEWDLDNLVAPVVSTLGDVVTVPALWLATFALGHGVWSNAGSALMVAAAVAAGVLTWRTHRARLRRIVQESMPILAAAAVLSALAGLVLEKRLVTFQALGAVLVLEPAFVSSAGALGGLLTSRVSTGLHLGTIEPTMRPTRALWRDARVLALLAVPVYVFNAAGAHFVGGLLGEASPGLGMMVAASLLGALGAVAFVVVIAYYGSIVAVRFGVDPDTYGIPIVTSSVDFVGAMALVLALAVLGLT